MHNSFKIPFIDYSNYPLEEISSDKISYATKWLIYQHIGRYTLDAAILSGKQYKTYLRLRKNIYKGSFVYII